MAPFSTFDLSALHIRSPNPTPEATTRTSPPTRASLSKEGGFLEAWAQGYYVGSLVILILIVFCNYRSGILLHKLVLLEVGTNHHIGCTVVDHSSSFSLSGMGPLSSSKTPTTAGTSQQQRPCSSFLTSSTMSLPGSKSDHFCQSGARACSLSPCSACSLSGSPKPGPTSRTSTALDQMRTSACAHGKPSSAILGGYLPLGS
jgi:hypothetical protein